MLARRLLFVLIFAAIMGAVFLVCGFRSGAAPEAASAPAKVASPPRAQPASGPSQGFDGNKERDARTQKAIRTTKETRRIAIEDAAGNPRQDQWLLLTSTRREVVSTRREVVRGASGEVSVEEEIIDERVVEKYRVIEIDDESKAATNK